MREKKVDILKPIIKGYGKKAQQIQAIEELGELSSALCRYINGKDKTIDKITEEMADVGIMLDQLKIIFNNEPDIQKVVNSKIKRTYQRLGIEDGQK